MEIFKENSVSVDKKDEEQQEVAPRLRLTDYLLIHPMFWNVVVAVYIFAFCAIITLIGRWIAG